MLSTSKILEQLTEPSSQNDLNWEEDLRERPEPFARLSSLVRKLHCIKIQRQVDKKRVFK